MRRLASLAALLLAGCTVTPAHVNAPGQVCTGINCFPASAVRYGWSAPFIPVGEHPHPEGSRDGPVKV